RYSPTRAVERGFHEYDAQLEDRSRARIEARIAELHVLLDRLATIDQNRLSFDDRIDATAIGDRTRAELLSLETLRTWETNPMEYARPAGDGIDAVMKRDFAPKKDRLRSAIARLRGIPALLAAARANVSNPPREFTDVALGMARGAATFLEEDVARWAA